MIKSLLSLLLGIPLAFAGISGGGGGGGGGGTWGSITGTLSSQTDLATALSPGIYDAGNSGSTLTVDFTHGPAQKMLMTANCTFTLSNPVTGSSYVFHMQQDSTGGRTVSWPTTVRWVNNAAPSLSGANKIDLINLFYNGTGYLGTYALNVTAPSSNPFVPTQISNLVLWLDGNDTSTMNSGSGISDGTALSAWNDKSGAGNNAAQSSSSLRPVYRANVVNGLSAVQFVRQTLDFGSATFYPANAAWDWIAVMKWDGFESSNNFFFTGKSTTAHQPAFGTDNAGTFFQWIGNTGEWGAWQYTQSINTTAFHIVEVKYDNVSPTTGNHVTMRYDRSDLTNSTGSAGYGSGANLGSPDGTLEANFMLKGKVAALLIYSKLLNSTERGQIEQWVNDEYGI